MTKALVTLNIFAEKSISVESTTDKVNYIIINEPYTTITFVEGRM